jgi:outer membrane protein OmpA-like peptidoglycan-associated protein
MDISAKLEATEPTTVIVGGVAQSGEFLHTFNATLNTLGIEPYLRYSLLDNLNFNVSFNISYLLTKNYSQKEQITKPSNSATFLDENGDDTFSRTRNEFSGELQKATSLLFSPINLGVSYSMPLNKNNTLKAEPEIIYSLFGTNNIVDDPLVSKWSVSHLRMGVAIKYTPEPTKEKIYKYEKYEQIDTTFIESDLMSEIDFRKGNELINQSVKEDDDFIVEISRIERTDTIYKPKKYLISTKIKAVGLDKDMNEIPNPKFVVEEISTARLQPLLNYIFFDSLSSDINTRYTKLTKSEISTFSVDSLYNYDVIATYRHLLNIVGKRMIDNPTATITLTGCNDGSVSEKNSKSLSLSRANSIKDYLVNTWGINSDRISVKSRNLPEKASTPINDTEKAQENRRVEITSNSTEIIKPVFATYKVRTINLPGLRFKPEVNAEAGLKSWEIHVKQAGKEIKKFNFDMNTTNNVDWVISNNQKEIPILELPLEYYLVAYDNKNHSGTSNQELIDIQQMTILKKREQGISDKSIENYSLILFDFDKSDISSNNKDILNFIKSRLQNNSNVFITGYTDRTGDDVYNQKLSERRALGVFNDLKHPGSSYKGLGEENLLYDNNFPEGRFYCRTINIMVESEVK